VAKYDLAGLGDVLVELQANRGGAQQGTELTLTHLDRVAPQVHAIDLEQVEGEQEDGAILAAVAQPVE
jgi:hypothetical protein